MFENYCGFDWPKREERVIWLKAVELPSDEDDEERGLESNDAKKRSWNYWSTLIILLEEMEENQMPLQGWLKIKKNIYRKMANKMNIQGSKQRKTNGKKKENFSLEIQREVHSLLSIHFPSLFSFILFHFFQFHCIHFLSLSLSLWVH